MKKIGNQILGVLAIAVGYFGMKYGIASYREYTTTAKIENAFSDVQKQAAETHPDLPLSEATRKHSVELTSKKITGETDQRKKLDVAGSTFYGFYFVNVRERDEFCRERGVDIRSFVAAFQRSHVRELGIARTTLPSGIDDEEKLYTLVKSQLRQAVTQDMNDIATVSKVSLKEACQWIADNGPDIAAEMHLSKIQPLVYQTLNGRL